MIASNSPASLQVSNESLANIDEVLQIGQSQPVDSKESNKTSSSEFYAPFELVPYLKKPPSERDAPGEFGHPFEMPLNLAPSVQREIAKGYQRYSFNVLASDIISLHRNLGDKREDVCKVRGCVLLIHHQNCLLLLFWKQLRRFWCGTEPSFKWVTKTVKYSDRGRGENCRLPVRF